MLNIIVADRHPVVRKGVIHVITGEYKDVQIFEAKSWANILNALEKSTYDILISDIFQDDTLRIEWVQQISAKHPDLPILILSSHAEEIFGVRMIKSGAMGYISKRCQPKELLKAIVTLLNGKKYITSTLAELMAEHLVNNNKELHHGLLSAREFEVLSHIATGKNYSEIAKILFLSPNTISTYRSRIMGKMNFRNNYDLIRYSLDNKLV